MKFLRQNRRPCEASGRDVMDRQAEPVAIAPVGVKKVKSEVRQRRDRSGNTQQHQNGNTNKLNVSKLVSRKSP